MGNMYDALNRCLWWILMLHTGVKANGKVRSSGRGNGLEGYWKMYLWYNRMSGSTLHQLRIDVMKPQQSAPYK